MKRTRTILLLLVPGIAWAQAPTQTSLPEEYWRIDLVAGAPYFPTMPEVQLADAGSDKPMSPCLYPDWALNAHVQGTTHVALHRTADGRYVDISITKSSGNAELDAETIRCISHWHAVSVPPDSPLLHPLYKISVNWILGGIQAAVTGHSLGYAAANVYDGPERIGSADCADFYTAAKLDSGIAGTTTVKTYIAADGHVTGAETLRSSGNEQLDQANIACAKSWKFRPMTKYGVAIPTATSVLVERTSN